MKVNPIQNYYYSNKSFKGSIDKSIIDYLKSVENQHKTNQSAYYHRYKVRNDEFITEVESFMSKTNENTLLTLAKWPYKNEDNQELAQLIFKDTKTGTKILADEFIVPNTGKKGSREIFLMPVTMAFEKLPNGSYSGIPSEALFQWGKSLISEVTPEEVDLALKNKINHQTFS